MYSSYFFIPADKPRFISKMPDLEADYFIFDMEESVCDNAVLSCIDNLKKLRKIEKNYFVRIPIDYENCENAEHIIKDLYQIGFSTFLIPKVRTQNDIQILIRQIPNEINGGVRFGLLVETPSFLVDFYNVAREYRKYISLVLIGSHDYCNIVGCKHSYDNLLYIRQKLLAECKALELPIIDYVSTDFVDKKKFAQECVKSCNEGFDGRAIIHPEQLDAFNNARYYTEDEVKEALKVKSIIDKIDMANFSTLNIDGKLYEKPHIRRIYNIANWQQKYFIYDL